MIRQYRTVLFAGALLSAGLLVAGCPNGGDPDPNPSVATFEYAVRHATDAQPYALAVGDLNGDGAPDVATANFGPGTVSLLLSDGDGGFRVHEDYVVGDVPEDVAVADLSGDGHLDVVTADTGSDQLSMLLGLGGGNFMAAEAITLPGGAAPTSVATGDVDADGLPDLVCANGGLGTVYLFRGSPGGDFAAPVSVTAGGTPRGLCVTDLDGVPGAELAVALRDSGEVVVAGMAGGSFVETQRVAVGLSPRSVVSLDANGDAHTDLAVSCPGSREVYILAGSATGAYTVAEVVALRLVPTRMIAVDLNRDGREELVTVLFSNEETPVPLGLAQILGGGGFEETGVYALGPGTRGIAAADMTADGLVDLVAANTKANLVSVVQGRGNGGLVGERRFAAGEYPRALVTGDFNEDGRVDLITGNRDSLDLSVFLNQGGGRFLPEARQAVGHAPWDIEVGDLDDDDHLDLVISDRSLDRVSIFLGRGDGTFNYYGSATTRAAGAAGWGEPRHIDLGDLNGDGILDLAAGNAKADTIAVRLGDGDGSFAPAVELALGNYPLGVHLAYLNADAYLDLVFVSRNDPDDAGDAGQPWLIRVLGRGDGTFDEDSRLAYTISDGPSGLTLADVDRDGLMDAITVHAGGDVVDVLFGSGAGKFVRETRNTGSGPNAVAVADVDGDGYRDIITTNNTETISILRGAAGGRQYTHFELDAGTDPFAPVAADFDSDGNVDLAFTNRFTDGLGLLLGAPE